MNVDVTSYGGALADWIRQAARTSQTLSTHAVNDACRLVITLAVFLRKQCDALVITDDDLADPILVSYQSDDWSTFVSQRSVGTAPASSGRSSR